MWFPLRCAIFMLSLLVLVTAAAKRQKQLEPSAQLCGSLDIQQAEQLSALTQCRIVVGHVRIANVDVAATATLLSGNFSSTLEEITDYLLIYRIHGLDTLEQLFANLKLIRGRELLFDEYSLVVYENRHLINLGLVALKRIQKGHVRIEGNPQLCYIYTVNWVNLFGNATQQQINLKNNKSPNHCPLCEIISRSLDPDEELEQNDASNENGSENTNGNDNESSVSHHIRKNCWKFGVLQSLSAPNYATTCASKGGGDACCNPNCLGNCTAAGCLLCSTFRLGSRCVENCIPPFLEFNKRECVLEQVCYQNGLLPHAGRCVEKCPSHYQRMVDAKGKAHCILTCNADYVVHTTKDLDGLIDCVTIKGSLTIELTEMNSKIVNELENVFMSLREITGYLMVKHSPQLVSLGFLRNLNMIRGQQLFDNKYSLYVVNNHHLEHIWTQNNKVEILHGRLYFHLNPRLCYNKVLALQTSLRDQRKISVVEASPNSNGERVICGSAVRTLNAIVEDYNATAARIKVNPMSANDKVILLGYLHHYREAPQRNITMYDGRHGCGHDHWRMDLTLNANVRHIIANLKPYTQYAYFVKTLTMTDYYIEIDAYSPIQYFRTMPSKPGPVAKVFYHSLSTSEIELHWWPPRYANGIIEKYIINYEEVTNYNISQEKPKHFLNNCECAMLKQVSRGPPPEDENYYAKERVIYDESLANLVYVRREPAKKRRKELINATWENETLTNPKNAEDDPASHARKSRKTFEPNEPSANDIYHTVQPTPDNENNETAKGEKSFRNFSDTYEIDALNAQDTGFDDFPIKKPPTICNRQQAPLQYQLDNNCTLLDQFAGIQVSGQLHTYTLTNLKPEATYRITVRACVADLANGCGRKTELYAETVSKKIELFLKSLQELY